MADDAKNTTLDMPKRVPCEVYSRIVGYLRPVRDWNLGKQQEFGERRTYDIRQACVLAQQGRQPDEPESQP